MGRNWEWSFKRGYQSRLGAEVIAHKTGNAVGNPPVHSLDVTMQSQFEKGWHSVTPAEIQRAVTPPPQSIGAALRQNVRLRDLLGIKT